MTNVKRIVIQVDDSQVEDATKELKKLDKANEDAAKSTKQLEDSADDAGASMEDLGDEVQDVANNVSIFGVGLGNAVKRLREIIKSTNLWGVAIKAVPIVAVAAALKSMATFVNNTKRGQDALRVSTSQLNAAFAELRDNVSKLGERGFNDISRRLTLLISGFNGLTRAITGSSSALAEEARVAGILEQRLILTQDAERNLRVERAQANVIIEEQKLIAEDLTRANSEREAAAVAALETERKLLFEEIKLGERFVQILKEQQALGENTNEDLEELAQAEINLANLRQTSATKQIELNNKLNTIRAEGNKLLAEETLFEIQKLDIIGENAEEALKIAEELGEERRRLFLDEVRDFAVAEQQKTNISKKEIENRVQLASESFDIISSTLNSFNVKSKEIAIAQATISTFEGANKAFAQGGVLGFITAAAIIAAGLANVATIASTDIPAFAEGVIDLQGPGTQTSDSIPARLSRGESVMTAKETKEFMPTLKAMRKGDLDADLINSISVGAPVASVAPTLIEVPRDQIIIDEDGLTVNQFRRHDRMKLKQSRYKTNMSL